MPIDVWAPRKFFDTDHEDFRAIVREFIDREVRDNIETWDAEGVIPDNVWLRAGELGILGLNAPEELGGTTEIMKVLVAREALGLR